MKNKNYSLFLDLDDTIANFSKSYYNHFFMSIKDYEKKFGRKKLEKDLNSLGKKFWTELELLPNALQLWVFCISNFEKVSILSSPGIYDHSKEGKTEWVEKFLPNSEKIEKIYDRDKYKYGAYNHILVDDYQKNIDLWITKGNGIGILFESTKQVIERLEEILKNEV